MKIKMVKTVHPYCMTIVFEDDSVKFYDLSNVTEFTDKTRKLMHSGYEFLKPYVGIDGDSVLWHIRDECIEFSSTLVEKYGEPLSDRDIEYNTNYFEMRSFYQSTSHDPYESYSFGCPFTVRVALYSNYSSEDEAEANRQNYGKFINHHANLHNIGVFEDEHSPDYPNSLDAPQLTRLLEQCKERKLDVIFTDSIFNFANTITASIEIVEKLFDIGVMVYFFHEPYLCDEFIFDNISSMFRKMTCEKALPETALGTMSVLRVLDPERKNPFGEVEKYLDLPYFISLNTGYTNRCVAEMPELGCCRAVGPTPDAAIAKLKEVQMRRIYDLMKRGRKIPLPRKKETTETSVH